MTIVKSNALNKALFLSFVMMYHALGRQGVFAMKICQRAAVWFLAIMDLAM